MIIDFHTHAFKDSVAERALPLLAAEADYKSVLDGKVGSLLRSMDEAGVDVSVVSSIATKVGQYEPILKWSDEVRSDRIIPFASIHPDDKFATKHIDQIKREGFQGLKLHPYYQEFELDEGRMDEIYAAISENDLVLLCHTGFDIAFDRVRCCDPARIRRVVDKFTDLKFVASHFGSWEDWDEVDKWLIGRDIYIETSFSIRWMGVERARDFFSRHGSEYLMWGTDSPWGSQSEDMAEMRGVGTGIDEAYFGGNARRLLGI
jgi:hypothetical protein